MSCSPLVFGYSLILNSIGFHDLQAESTGVVDLQLTSLDSTALRCSVSDFRIYNQTIDSSGGAMTLQAVGAGFVMANLI